MLRIAYATRVGKLEIYERFVVDESGIDIVNGPNPSVTSTFNNLYMLIVKEALAHDNTKEAEDVIRNID